MTDKTNKIDEINLVTYNVHLSHLSCMNNIIDFSSQFQNNYNNWQNSNRQNLWNQFQEIFNCWMYNTFQTRVVIHIIDSNNHSPVFKQPVYRLYVTENDAAGPLRQSVGSLTARDADFGQNGRVTYHITSTKSLMLFDIQVTHWL